MADENLYTGSSAAQIGAFAQDLDVRNAIDAEFLNRLISSNDPDAELSKLRKEIKNETIGTSLMFDLETGMAHGSAIGGAWGSLIGIAGGLVRMAIDGVVMGMTLDEKLDDVMGEVKVVAERFEEAMNLRDDIMSQIAQYTSPLEQVARTRARAFARQAAASGLTGAQALQAQFINEQVYRAQVGPNMPAVIESARRSALEAAALKLQAIEKEYGITLALENRAVAQASQPSAASKIAGGIANLASGLGTSIGFLAGEQQARRQSQDDLQSGLDSTVMNDKNTVQPGSEMDYYGTNQRLV